MKAEKMPTVEMFTKVDTIKNARAREELPGVWRERVVQPRSGPVLILERIDPSQRFPWLSDCDFDELPWRP